MERTSAAPPIHGVTTVGEDKWKVMGAPFGHRSMVKIKAEERRKRELVKVHQEYIEALLSRPPCHDLGPSNGIADRTFFPHLCERICTTTTDFDEVVRMVRAQDANIIEQYKRNGVAYVEAFVDGDINKEDSVGNDE